MPNISPSVRAWELLQRMESAYQQGNYTALSSIAQLADSYTALGTSTDLLTAWISYAAEAANPTLGVVLTLQTVTGGTPPTDAEVRWTFADGRSTTISNKALTSNVATLTTSGAHRLRVGQKVTIAGVGAPFDGLFTITVVTTNTFSYACTNANIPSAAATGTLVLNGAATITTDFASTGQKFVTVTVDTSAFEPVAFARYITVPYVAPAS